jgi:hypothetical protein
MRFRHLFRIVSAERSLALPASNALRNRTIPATNRAFLLTTPSNWILIVEPAPCHDGANRFSKRKFDDSAGNQGGLPEIDRERPVEKNNFEQPIGAIAASALDLIAQSPYQRIRSEDADATVG